VPTAGFGGAFAFAEPAVLTQNWTQANVFLATVVGLLLLAAWVGVVFAADRWGGRFGRRGERGRAVVLAGLGVVSLVAVIQLTTNIAQANLPAQEANTTGLVTASGLRPGQVLAVGEGIHAQGVSWESWMPQAFEIWWSQLEFFNPAKGPPPANATVVETEWLPGQSAQASWPQAPPGWRIVASDQAAGWVAWRR
jgi:MFS family permease